MKRLFCAVLFLGLLLGCAAPQIKYDVPSGKEAAYNQAVVECMESVKPSGNPLQGDVAGGLFVGVFDIPKVRSRGQFRECLEGKGFKCIENCPPTEEEDKNRKRY